MLCSFVVIVSWVGSVLVSASTTCAPSNYLCDCFFSSFSLLNGVPKCIGYHGEQYGFTVVCVSILTLPSCSSSKILHGRHYLLSQMCITTLREQCKQVHPEAQKSTDICSVLKDRVLTLSTQSTHGLGSAKYTKIGRWHSQDAREAARRQGAPCKIVALLSILAQF